MTLVVLGVGLLLVLGADVFSTIFSPWGRGGLVNRRQNQLIWGLFRRIGTRRDGSARDHLLALGGPVLVVITLGLWMVWLVVGFALIYLPFVDSFLFSVGSQRAPIVEAFYFSGYTAATLGLGDMIPDREDLRLLTLLEAFGGFALLSISVTYFLAVYRELLAKQSIASTIGTYFEVVDRDSPAGETDGSSEPFARWCEEIAWSLSTVLLSHYQYPVLNYFRSSSDRLALPVQLGSLIDLRRRVKRPDAPERLAALARHPSYLALERTVENVVTEVGSRFVPETIASRGFDPRDDVEEAYERLRAYMLYS